MDNAEAKVLDLIFGSWRSQILYAGVQLGVFETLGRGPASAGQIASALQAEARLLYRLMRALGALALLHEDPDQRFTLTPMGEVLCRDHPQSLRGLTLLEAGPEHAAAWTHLSELITAGQQDAFGREVGESVYTYAEHDSSYDAILDEGLRTYARLDHPLVVETLATYDFSGITHLCDVGGGHGLTLGSLLVQPPHLRGTVLERPRVLAQPDAFWAAKLGVGDRCTYVSGDMFHAVPPADAYLLKRILHNWNDAECGQILSTIHRAAPSQGRVFIIEHIVPGPDTPHFAKLCDLQMLVLLTGRERTLEEYTGLLAGAGWTYRQTWYPASKRLAWWRPSKPRRLRGWAELRR